MILHNYIYKEIAYKLFPICALLLLIFISKYYVGYLADAASGKISTQLVTTFLWLKIVASLPKMLPICLLISVILAFSRLVRDNELVIFHTSGAGRSFEYSSTLTFALVFSLFFSGLVFYLAPYAQERIAQLKEQAKRDSDITGITAGRFKEFSKGDRVVYVEGLSADRSAMSNVFLQVRELDKLGVLSSDIANFEWDDELGNRYIVFKDGRRYVGNPGEQDYQITEYEKYAVLVEQTDPAQSTYRDPKGIGSIELMNSNKPSYQAEFQWRISLVICCILLTMLAVLLNSLSWNDKQYTLIFIGLLIYIIYTNLLGISKTMLSRDQLSPFIGLWWVHVLMIGFLFILFVISNIKKRRRKYSYQEYTEHHS